MALRPGYSGTTLRPPAEPAYGLSNSHVAWSQCSDYYPYSTSDSLTVNKPTMTGYDAVWFLGATGQSQSGYANITYETAHTNCGASDTCTDTPSWTATGNTSEISFLCNPCAVQTVGGVARSNTFHDIQLVVSIGGFSSDPLPFTVYAPYELTCCNMTSNSAFFDGFETTVTLTLYDRFNDPLVGLAYNESFTATLIPDYAGLSGWGQPTAGGVAGGWVGSMGNKWAPLMARVDLVAPLWRTRTALTRKVRSLQLWRCTITRAGKWAIQ